MLLQRLAKSETERAEIGQTGSGPPRLLVHTVQSVQWSQMVELQKKSWRASFFSQCFLSMRLESKM